MRKLCTAVLAGVLSLVVVPAAQAGSHRPLQVVALGDSYASGVGAGDYEAGTDGNCYRSANSGSAVVVAGLRARGKQVDFTNVTCSGAAIADLSTTFKEEPPQLDALKADTNLVLMTMGGNDIEFAAYAGQCIQSDCAGAGTQALLDRLPAMTAKLTALLGEIKARSPRARIVLSGYGRQFNPGENATGVALDPICGDGILTPQERTDGATVATSVDQALRTATSDARAQGVNAAYASAFTDGGTLRTELEGHSMCQADTPFYRGLEAVFTPGQEGVVAVLHPSRAGQAAFAALVECELR
ncbi:SGNH/GDSL hydrolase family protein [Umezawaea tangerina]|uniref:GDSL-like lipase/acylhydrolase family protein n=1 Tax=Umezawaea tangerina TaxID=84725 RepID=A0A2T0TKA7_9PSEU|nr:SGNH/GDSL hydrolase family protein [Umezawaea tangerina]PRY46093.1 GDSL-like lipase/acylhydrolase family protein [Umezawaea tangerina]